MKFEYQTTFVKVAYHAKNNDSLLLERPLAYEPIIESLTGNPAYKEHLEYMGNQGWQLVSVQPLLKGVGGVLGSAGYGYSLTEGYYLFWSRIGD
jgi:hypothetical protein